MFGFFSCPRGADLEQQPLIKKSNDTQLSCSPQKLLDIPDGAILTFAAYTGIIAGIGTMLSLKDTTLHPYLSTFLSMLVIATTATLTFATAYKIKNYAREANKITAAQLSYNLKR